MQTGAQDWQNYPAAIPAFVRRLQGVTIECRPALEMIEAQDEAETLFYCDPPYLPETRSALRTRTRGYLHEMTAADHAELLERLKGLRGMAVVSGYPSRLYDEALAGWMRVETEAKADGAKVRTEVLWISPRAAERHGPLFHREAAE